LAVLVVSSMVKLGTYPEDWGGDGADNDARFGERN
jgi:hypothetical protein